MKQYAEEIKTVVDAGLEVAIVIGGGNIFRGYRRRRYGTNPGRLHGHVGDGHQLHGFASALESAGVDTRLQSAIELKQIAEPFIRRRAVRHGERARGDFWRRYG